MPVTAGVVRNAEMRTLAAFFDVAAEGSGAAGLDSSHDAQLLRRQAMRGAIGGAVLSKNVSQFENWPGHSGLLFAWALGRECEPIQRTDGFGESVGGHCGIARSGLDTAVAQQYLNHARVGTVLQQVSGETVPERVGGDAFGDARVQARVATGDG